jgi:hypothetical protein
MKPAFWSAATLEATFLARIDFEAGRYVNYYLRQVESFGRRGNHGWIYGGDSPASGLAPG